MSISNTDAGSYLRRIEQVLDAIEQASQEYKKQCGELRADIKEIYLEAKDNGVGVQALKGLVKHRKLQRAIGRIDVKFDAETRAEYDRLVEQLGELGAAAARQAGYDASGFDFEDRDDPRAI